MVQLNANIPENRLKITPQLRNSIDIMRVIFCFSVINAHIVQLIQNNAVQLFW